MFCESAPPRATSCARNRALAILAVATILGAGSQCQAQKINALMLGFVTGNTLLEQYFDEDPSISYTAVPCWHGTGLGEKDMAKAVRLYFPRRYDEMKRFDYIMLLSAEFQYFTSKQDAWMYDAIVEGAGGFNDGSVFSIIAQVHQAWANSLCQRAFPNDAPAVVARGGGGESPVGMYKVVINRDFPDPVLTPFIPYRVEDVPGLTSRFVIPRENSRILAWQVGNFPTYGKVPYLIVWEYGAGRTMTCGGFIKFGETWLGKENPYGPDIVMNLVFYSTQRKLIDDVDTFHRLKLSFREFWDRLGTLISLRDFVDRFGANTEKIQKAIMELEQIQQEANENYLRQDFPQCRVNLDAAFQRFDKAESLAKRVKDRALAWVYFIEWVATTATILVSSAILWALLVARRLYREVKTTGFQ